VYSKRNTPDAAPQKAAAAFQRVDAAGAIRLTPGATECRKGDTNDPSAKILASALNRCFNHPKIRLAIELFFRTSIFSSADTNDFKFSCICVTCWESAREALLISFAIFVVSWPYLRPFNQDLDASSILCAIK
jgi:hypothetical protein